MLLSIASCSRCNFRRDICQEETVEELKKRHRSHHKLENPKCPGPVVLTVYQVEQPLYENLIVGTC